MKAHPIAGIICIMSGVFGAVFLIAFAMAFDPTVVSAREADDADPKEKPARWINMFLTFTRWSGQGSPSEYDKVWADTKGSRFLVPLGVALCGLSYTLYALYLK